MLLIIVFSVIAIIMVICIICLAEKRSKDLTIFALMFLITICICIGAAIESITSIKAIEVYRGNTDIKVIGEYKDSIFIPTDTIVIIKKINKIE